MRMQEAVLANHQGAGIGKRGEVSGKHLPPYLLNTAVIIDADGQYPHPQAIKVLIVLRELAQFSHAVGSPVTAIEDENDRMAAQGDQMYREPSLVAESEIGSWLTCGQGDLGWWQSRLRERRTHEEEADENEAHGRMTF
jgi:hypothetical protein